MSKEARITPEANGRFKLKHGNDEGDSEANYPAIHFSQGSGPQLIVFEIAPGPEKFNAQDPIWVSATGKPAGPANHDQIVDAKVLKGGKTLVVINKNSEEGTLYYNLNMIRGNGDAATLDPVITNGGGGGGGGDQLYSAVYLVGAAVIGALLSVLVVRFALGWR